MGSFGPGSGPDGGHMFTRMYTPLAGPRSRTSGVMSCDLNPQPVSSGNGFDYNSIKNSVTQNLVETQSKPQAPPSVVPRGGNTDADDERTEQILNNTSRLSRSNSVIERSYSRSNVRASSVSRTSSFADRSYGTRTNLGTTSTFAIADYTSA